MHEYREDIPECLGPILEGLEKLEKLAEIGEWKIEKPKQKRKKLFKGEELLKIMKKNEILVEVEPFEYKIPPFLTRREDRNVVPWGQPLKLERNQLKREEYINVIPGDGPGKCCEKLLVIIGDRDSFEMRILEAIEHCTAFCLNVTKYVVFYTINWEGVIWERHRAAFENNHIVVVKRGFAEFPIRLC